jgi:hypothetical protein
MTTRPLLFLAASLAAAQDVPQEAARILRLSCQPCHGAAMKQSDLDLRTRAAMLAGGKRGAAVAPGEPEKSNLFLFAAHRVKPEMPPGAKLSDGEIETLRRWIAEGAPMEDRAQPEAPAKKHWAFVAPVDQAPPEVKNRAWVRNAVDAFILAQLEQNGLRPAPTAGRRALVRRAYLDLWGLPPSPEEVAEFLRDTSADAWPRLIERLLASPHYGERWGRHWLDLVRYADSAGFEFDRDRPNAWRYRDYVIRSFNNDKPYDRFLREQIAGDEIAPGDDDAMTATGYLRLGVENNIRDERTRLDELDDVVSTTSLAMLGMTVGCARCHDHKFDPIPTEDYYRIQAVFFPARPAEHPLAPAAAVAAFNAAQKEIAAMQAPLEKERTALEKPYRDRIFEQKLAKLPEYMQIAWRTPAENRTEGQRLNAQQIRATMQITDEEILAIMSAEDKARRETLVREHRALDRRRPRPYPTAMAIGERSREAPASHLLLRGDPSSKGAAMKPGVLSAASAGEAAFPEPPAEARSSWRRRGFAEWVASPENPLTARVMVNRIWQHHFGRGIVATPSNFGKTGQAPTHPELLDWLALEFLRSGWSVKAMHRLIVNSNAYRMAARDDSEGLRRDPSNKLFWRMPRRRLEAEALRDAMLAVAGTLDRTVGGEPVLPYIDPSLFQSSSRRTWNGRPDDDPSTWRRSLYVFAKRSIRYPMFEAFDQPDMIVSCDRRNQSTTAPQALLLMNNDAVLLHSRAFALRVRREAGPEAGAQVDRAFQLALARPPSPVERRDAVDFVRSSPEGLEDFCQALFNLNEFAYIP